MTSEALRLFFQQNSFHPGKVVFTRKPTLIEVRLEKAGRSLEASHAEALEFFGNSDPRFERAWSSHLRQLETCRLVLSALDDPVTVEAKQIFARSTEAIAALSGASLVVVCGGDEYIKSVIRLCSAESHVLPINSDPQTSHGTCALSLKDIARWHNGEVQLSAIPWKSIEARSQGEFIGRAVDTVFVGNPRQLTRTRLTGSVISCAQDNSGASSFQWDCNYALLNTGLGSTGWVLSAAREICSPAISDNPSDTDVSFELYVSQPYQGREISALKIPSQRLSNVKAIEIQSLMNEGGICAFGDRVIELNRGDTVHARFAEGVSDVLSFGIYSSDLVCRMTHRISVDPKTSEGFMDSPALYVGNESKLFMSRYIVRLYEEKEGVTVVGIEEEQKSSGIFLAASGWASKWSRQTCYTSDHSMRAEFVFKPSDGRFDLLIVGNHPSSPGLTSEEHLAFKDRDKILTLTPDEPCTVAFDSYHQVEVEGAVEFRLGRQGVPVFGLAA